jgi:hypothetical protein
MIDLANGMSYTLGDVSHGFWPRKYVQFTIILVPTPGAIAPDPDVVEKYGINNAIFFSTDHEPERTHCLALLGKNVTVVRDWVMAEWAKYKVSPTSAWTPLIPVFDYVAEVGLAP